MESLFLNPFYYYIWIAGFTTILASSLLLFKLGLSIRGSMLGRVIFYLSFTYILWTPALLIHATTHALTTPIEIVPYIAILAGGIVTLQAVVIGLQMQLALAPRKKTFFKHRALFIPVSLGLTIGVLGAIRSLVNNPFIALATNGLSVQTSITLIIIGLGMAAFLFLEDRGSTLFLRFCGAITVTISAMTLVGIWFKIDPLFLQEPGVGMAAPTATAVMGIGIIFLILDKINRPRLLITALCMVSLALIIPTLAAIGYLSGYPELYSPHSYARMSLPTIIATYSYTIAILLSLWNKI